MDQKREVLDLLLENARESAADIARQTGLDEDTVTDIVADLESSGVVRGYQAVVDWDRVGTEHVQAELELNVELDRETKYDDIATRIAKFPEVVSLKLVSGNYDFAVIVEGESMQDVSHFVAEQIAPIPEVTQTVTHFVMEVYKDRNIVFTGGEVDERLSYSP